MDLEEIVTRSTKHKLRDFIRVMSGGSTPKVTEADKYYSDSENGIPFLRVQNLSPEGLDWVNCKHINHETHNGLLKRSQVFGGDLLIKITGVGRMAITSIAPEGFEGNINQHMVVVKGKEPELNPLIAAFLNSDIGEMLATRRSTGGTRPALDYQALRSIPIILNDSIHNIMDEAYKIKKLKEKEAQSLLGNINDYLLGKLDITLPNYDEDTLENRIFYVESNEVFNGRFDPRKYSLKFQDIFDAIENSSLDHILLKDLITQRVSGNWGSDDTVSDDTLIKCLTIRATEFDNRYNLKLDNSRVKYRKYTHKTFEKVKLEHNDILIEKSGGSEDQPVGRVAIIEDSNYGDIPLAFSNFIHKIKVNSKIAYPEFIFEYLTLMHSIKITETMQTQTNGIRNLIMGEYFNQTILLPSKSIQKGIIEKISGIRNQARILENEAEEYLAKSKSEVERILLGDGTL